MKEDLPPTIPSMWRLCKLGYRHEPSMMAMSLLLATLSALPDSLVALWFKLIADGIQRGGPRLVWFGTVALALSATGGWFLRVLADRVHRRFRDKVTIALEAHVATLQASIATIAHQEVPEYLDRVAMLRDQVF